MKPITVERVVGGTRISLTSGHMARQANGSVTATWGETAVLGTATMGHEPKNEGFFPLSVHYVEKTYSYGQIPGSFHRREGKPSEAEVLTSRLIDRPIRPLFEKGFFYEVQLMPMVLNIDGKHPADMAGLLASSAALHISDIPFKKPIGSVRMGYLDGKLVVNPSYEDMEKSSLDLIIAGTKDAITMIEGHAHELSEELMLEALEVAHKTIVELVELQEEFRDKVGKPKVEVELAKVDESLVEQVAKHARPAMEKALTEKDKLRREATIREIGKATLDAMEEAVEQGLEGDIKSTLNDLEKQIVRGWLLDDGRRIDGRGLDELRPIFCEVDMFDSVHGASLFTRGETQALAAATLGTPKDRLKIETNMGLTYKSFFLHYNFPPYSVGEVGRTGSPGRREIGHGFLAEKSLANLLPSVEDFPYTIRLVSEIMESNGSSSMATVCAGSMALRAAGVPLKDNVAGIALGLVMEGDRYKILTDIQGTEDGLGDMDFKVAGTKNGITGFQLDIKVEGITMEIMKEALAQAKQARMQILDAMDKCIGSPREGVSSSAPQYKTISIATDKIKNLIGPGGKNIKMITEETGSDVEIEDSGKINIFASGEEAMSRTIELVEQHTGSPQVGAIYDGTVKKIMPFGAFVEIIPGTDGLCHISELEQGRVNQVTDVLNEGDKVRVKVMGIDDRGRINLSKKAAEADSK